MSDGLDLDRAALSVALDLRHPFAYLALEPTRELGTELGLAVDFLPLTAPTLRPPSPFQPDDDRGARHKQHRAHMIAREIAIYSEAQGLTLRETYRDGPADAANLAWLWVRREAPERLDRFLDELFRGYWSLDLDPGSPSEVARRVETCGLDPEPFLTWSADDGPRQLTEIAAALIDAGMSQAPAYRVGGELFLGRQHLPMIRWILQGRRGTGPI